MYTWWQLWEYYRMIKERMCTLDYDYTSFFPSFEQNTVYLKEYMHVACVPKNNNIILKQFFLIISWQLKRWAGAVN